ncbi:SDR family oxidoreductase sniffer [Lycorma delicatula]|uniref:SDR family oxidoreductase sniffer n=1 Tax=Lycorma delicatula TaxID=130591 RepID=UPI003F512A79
MNSVLITGCNRGIGLGLVKNLLTNNLAKSVIATCRDPNKAEELKELSQKYNNLHVFQLDLKDFNRYELLVKEVSDIVKGSGLNVLINNAGISSKFTRVNLVKAEQMTEHFLVNTTAPLLLTKAFIPLLKEASTLNSSAPLGVQRAAVINLSSVLGSIADNQQGGFYPYRCSKSALNAVTRSLSFDLKDYKILVMSLHPGWIKTDMGGKNALLDIEPASDTIVKLFLSLTDKHNGGFYQYDGKSVPW